MWEWHQQDDRLGSCPLSPTEAPSEQKLQISIFLWELQRSAENLQHPGHSKPRWDFSNGARGESNALGLLLWCLLLRGITQSNWDEAPDTQVLPLGWKQKSGRCNRVLAGLGNAQETGVCLAWLWILIGLLPELPSHWTLFYTDITGFCYICYCCIVFLFQKSPEAFSVKPLPSWISNNDRMTEIWRIHPQSSSLMAPPTRPRVKGNEEHYVRLVTNASFSHSSN